MIKTDFKTKRLKVADIIPYENNPRKNEEAVEPVENSMEQFGYKVPIVVTEDNVIITGHTRLKALEKAGVDEVTVIVADDLTDEQARAFRLADNKTGELAVWDFEALDIELFDIDEIDMEQFGFDPKNIDESDFFGGGGLEDNTNSPVKVCIRFENKDKFELCKSELYEFVETIDGAEITVVK